MITDSDSELAPSGPGDDGWQAHKSSTTRTLILDAAIESIVEDGYANTTTTKIADRAGLSRGATLHHFPSRMDIIRATVEYLYDKRIRAFRNATAQLPAADAGHDRIRQAVRNYWEHVNHPLFVAFFELSVAARHDEELAAILHPAQARFDDEWYRAAHELYPEWQSDPAIFDFALGLSQKLMEGAAVSLLMHPRRQDEDQFLSFLEAQIRALLPER